LAPQQPEVINVTFNVDWRLGFDRPDPLRIGFMHGRQAAGGHMDHERLTRLIAGLLLIAIGISFMLTG